MLLIAFYFPPAGGGGVQRPLKFATYLPQLGVETHGLAPHDPKWIHRDDTRPPAGVTVHRVRYVGPRGRLPAEELHGTTGSRRYARRAKLFTRRLLVPDENVSWALTAIPAAIRLVRRERFDAVVTTSPPGSIHLIGVVVKKITGVSWIADLRDPLIAHPHRSVERRSVRIKEQAQRVIAYAVAHSADAVVAVSDAISADMTLRGCQGRVVTIPNGADFDDFVGLTYRPSDHLRVTHTGSFFGQRNPRPFLSALKRVDGVSARFIGDFRARDREWADALQLGDRLELVEHVSRRRSLELQRDSEVLLLLIPNAGGRGSAILSGKVFEYIAAGRPILALVPPDGVAAQLLRDTGMGEVVDPEDVDAIVRALITMRDRFHAGELGVQLSSEWRETLSRSAGVGKLAELLRSLK